MSADLGDVRDENSINYFSYTDLHMLCRVAFDVVLCFVRQDVTHGDFYYLFRYQVRFVELQPHF